jgi:hypothetical protein
MYAGTMIGGIIGGPLLTHTTGFLGIAALVVVLYAVVLAIHRHGGILRRRAADPDLPRDKSNIAGSRAAGGDTIAALLGRVDRTYAAGHSELLGRVADVGLLVSELPPGATATRHRFLARDSSPHSAHVSW